MRRICSSWPDTNWMPYRFMCKGVEQTSEQRCEICKADLQDLISSKNASKRANLFSKTGVICQLMLISP